MRVAHLSSVHAPNDNRIFHKECRTLAAAGHDVTLIVAGAEAREREGVRVYGFPRTKGGRLARIFKSSFLDMLRACREVDADLYHFHDPELIPAGLWLKLRGKKVIYDIHENNPASILTKPYLRSNLLKRTLSLLFDRFEKMTVPFFDALVTARPDISERFRHRRLVTLRNFPRLPAPDAVGPCGIDKPLPSVIFVGGIAPLRGTRQLLEAFGRIEGVELWLLGPIQDPRLEEEIAKAGENIRYLGIVEPEEVFAYIERADAGIITFLPAPNHLRTLATKPFEYMACGKPVIMSDFPYWRETFGDSALYVNPEDPEAIAETVRSLFSDPERMAQMGERNLKRVREEYNWEKESTKLVELYRSLSE